MVKDKKKLAKQAAAFARLRGDLPEALARDEYVPMNLRDYSCRVIQHVFTTDKVSHVLL